MAGFSDTVENAVLNYVLRSTAMPSYTGGTVRKIALYTGDPGEAGTSNEVTGGSYARQDGTFNAASGGASALNADVDFTVMPACTVTHFGVWDSTGTPIFLAGGTCTNRTLEAGDTYRLLATTTTIALD